MTRYKAELIPTPTPPAEAETAAGTYRARVGATRLSEANGHLRRANSVILDAFAIAAEADAELARVKLALGEAIVGEGLALTARAEAAEAERDALRAAMPDPTELERIADAFGPLPVHGTILRLAAGRIRAALAAHGGAETGTGGIIECQHARSDMTPCWQKDGDMCLSDDGVCVGCGLTPNEVMGGG